jgi:hypothetical protein
VRLKDGQFIPRELNDQGDDEGKAGFLDYSKENPWPVDEDSLNERLPDEWLEEHRAYGAIVAVICLCLCMYAPMVCHWEVLHWMTMGSIVISYPRRSASVCIAAFHTDSARQTTLLNSHRLVQKGAVLLPRF